MTEATTESESRIAGGATGERRAHRRRTVSCLLNFHLGERFGAPVNIGVGKVVDVSMTGVRLETDRDVTEGQLLGLEVALEQRIVHATVRVVHSGRVEPGLFVIGAKFVSIGDRDRATLCVPIGVG